MESNKKKEASKRFEATDNVERLAGKKDVTDDAREEAMEDIEEDADLSIHSPNDDLDEGETARLGENKTDLV